MPGTKLGGQRATATNKAKYGESFYKKIGSKGGQKTAEDGVVKGWAAMDREKHIKLSSKGGQISRRTKKV